MSLGGIICQNEENLTVPVPSLPCFEVVRGGEGGRLQARPRTVRRAAGLRGLVPKWRSSQAITSTVGGSSRSQAASAAAEAVPRARRIVPTPAGTAGPDRRTSDPVAAVTAGPEGAEASGEAGSDRAGVAGAAGSEGAEASGGTSDGVSSRAITLRMVAHSWRRVVVPGSGEPGG